MNTTTTSTPHYDFYLGGHDLEMVTIRSLLERHHEEFSDKKLPWGAKASAYTDEIRAAISWGRIPVLIELTVDIELPPYAIVIDHHGDRSGEKASLLQVMELLKVEPSHSDLLIAANDSGYIPAMIKAGATEEQISTIRMLDRRSQGITEQMEADAQDAISSSSTYGNLRVVRLNHTKFATVTDRLFSTWPNGKENLIVICQATYQITNDEFEVYYFGRGDICRRFKDCYGGWGGGQGFGDANGQGFSGCKATHDQLVGIIDFVVHFNEHVIAF